MPFKEHNWVLFLFVAILEVPMSILGRAKVGGSLNSFSPTMYFMLVAVFLLLIKMWNDFSEQGRNMIWYRAKAFAVLVAFFFIQVQFLVILQFYRNNRGYNTLRGSKSQVAFEYLLENEKMVYFPDYPIVHLLHERTLYHYFPAIYDREVFAKIPVKEEHIRKHSPHRPEFICIYDKANSHIYVLPRSFPDYDNEVNIRALKDFTCYANSERLKSGG